MQLELVKVPKEPRLGDRQAFALEEIRRTPGGIFEADLGALLHARAKKHGPGERCEFCQTDGLHMLQRLRAKKLVVRRRRSGIWQLKRGHRRLIAYGPETEPADDPFPAGF